VPSRENKLKIVVDTNVFISGYFYGGVPLKVLEGWRDGSFDLLMSEEILDEYQQTGQRFAKGKLGPGFYGILNLISQRVEVTVPATLSKQVCDDPDDDKFLACALGGGASVVVSGDKALLECSGFRGITVLSPREFVETYLDS